MKFSKSTGGFYDVTIHGDAIPDDAVEITTEEHAALLEGQSQGKLIQSGTNGRPVLVDPPTLTPEQMKQANNSKHLKYLSDTDWYVVRQMDDGTPIPEEVKAKRAEARSSIVE